MTQDEIIRMAREAGFSDHYLSTVQLHELERFAALVAVHAKQEYIDSVYDLHRETMMTNKDLGMLVDAVKAEREACAKVCEEPSYMQQRAKTSAECAAAIRERSNSNARARSEK